MLRLLADVRMRNSQGVPKLLTIELTLDQPARHQSATDASGKLGLCAASEKGFQLDAEHAILNALRLEECVLPLACLDVRGRAGPVGHLWRIRLEHPSFEIDSRRNQKEV